MTKPKIARPKTRTKTLPPGAAKKPWVAFHVALPPDASVSLYVHGSGTRLAGKIDVPNDLATLTLLADALRAAVVEVEARRAEVAS